MQLVKFKWLQWYYYRRVKSEIRLFNLFALLYSGTFLTFFGKQLLHVRFFHCIRDLKQRTCNLLFHNSSISTGTAFLRGCTWRKVVKTPLEPEQTCLLLQLLGLALSYWRRSVSDILKLFFFLDCDTCLFLWN